MLRRWMLGLAALVVLVCLGGCKSLALDVEAQLVPPRSTGEQEKIQQALE